ncbi:MAG TPA: hypothetical protein VLW75_11135 [Rhizomicrobium sp.]|nr:hypothetical protein [Rhizomicrobium sp.]
MSMAGTMIGMSTAVALAFLAGLLLAHPGIEWRAWAWNSPWGRTCLIAAALWAGIAIASLVMSRLRDMEADNIRHDIDEARAYTRSLIARIDRHEQASRADNSDRPV